MIISIDDKEEVYFYIDRSHAVHTNEQRHSRMYLAIGKGRMMNISKKLDVITASSEKLK